MPQASFDTHAAIRKLEKAGCPVPQAEALVSVVMQAADPNLQLAREVQQLRLHVETRTASKSDFASIDDRFARVDERFASIDERLVEMATAIASLAEGQKGIRELMVTKGELFRAIWVQGIVLASLILTLSVSMVSFVGFMLNGS